VFERFSERARRVVILAREEAGRFRHDFVGTEHVLLGLIRDGEGIATAVLQRLGLRLEDVKAEVERTLAGFPKSLTFGEVPFTPQAKRVLELSIEEARQLGHNYIGTEHLLLGLMREGQSVAAKVLESLGARFDTACEETLALLGDQGDRRATAANKAAARSYFQDVVNRGDLAAADAVVADRVRTHSPFGDASGLQALKEQIVVVRDAFPDITVAIEDVLGEGDRVAIRWSLTGTRTGPLRGKAPSGARVAIAGNTVFRVRGGKIHEIWTAFDPGGLV